MKIGKELFEHYLLNSTHWIDVRAEVEFLTGNIPRSVNLPILNNEERHLVGTTYKQIGRQAAVNLGYQIVSGDIKEQRINLWKKEIASFSNSVIYCFRGGMRSQITQQWLAQEGIDCPIIEGGYKALRRYLIDQMNQILPDLNFEIVSGATGSGKTNFLYESGKAFIDLEKLAHHKGSAFGALGSDQPSQINFENSLAIEILKLRNFKEVILVENESRLIGKRIIPEVFFQKMKQSAKFFIEIAFEKRVDNIYSDYILNSDLLFNSKSDYFNRLRQSVQSISKKLGGQRTSEIIADLQLAENEFRKTRDLSLNKVWIEKLLKWYYDPMYEKNPKMNNTRKIEL